jgi:hypothetical protein
MYDESNSSKKNILKIIFRETVVRAGSASIPKATIPYRYRIVLVSIARIDIVSI